MGLTGRIPKQIRSAFHGVTRGMQDLNGNFPQRKDLPILGYNGLKRRISQRTINNRSSGFSGKGKVPAYKIGVKVGFKNVADFGPI